MCNEERQAAGIGVFKERASVSSLGKNIQMSLLVFLAAGTFFLYFQAFVSFDRRLAAIESSLPPEPDHDLSRPKEDEALEAKQKAITGLFNVAIPDEPGIPHVLGQLAKSARAAGIQGVSMATTERGPAESLGREMSLFQWPIRLRFMSEYSELAEFVHALQGMTRVVELTKISMRRLPPNVATELQVVVYSQIAPPVIGAEAAKLKKQGKQDHDKQDDEISEDSRDGDARE